MNARCGDASSAGECGRRTHASAHGVRHRHPIGNSLPLRACHLGAVVKDVIHGACTAAPTRTTTQMRDGLWWCVVRWRTHS